MRSWWTLVVLVALTGVGCSSPASEPSTPPTRVGDPAATSTTAAAPSTTTTTEPATTTTAVIPTTTTTTAAGLPSFYRYGSFGLAEVDAGGEKTLLNEPVASAWSAGAAGLVFSYDRLFDGGLPRGALHLHADASEPVALPDYYVHSVVNFDGRAGVVRYDDFEDRRCEPGSIGIYDLETGARDDLVICAGEGDVGWVASTYGGGLFAGVRWDDSGSCRTNSGILFWDRSGAEVDIPTNPYPLAWDQAQVPDWIPCELDAQLSPDGRLLAYRFRPDNKWPCPEYDNISYEEWLEESRIIPGIVVVLNLETGAELFRAQSEAEERLVDFDGRFIVLTTADRRWDVPLDELRRVEVSTIVDIAGNSAVQTVDGRVRLIWTGN